MRFHPSVIDGSRLDEEAEALAALIAGVQRIALFTGAGVSTECGVPDFRSPGSPWMVNKPIPFAAFMADEAVRAEAWRRKFAMDDSYRDARPGRGHAALAALVRSGKARGIITQNIDNLHQASGLSEHEVIELHGNGTYAACLACGLRHELHAIRPRFEASGAPPRCSDCSGPVKSATISFGQAMPEDAMRRAMAWSQEADLFLAIGSSLVVHPAARLPVMAREAGARLVIVNAGATPLDAAAHHVFRSDIGALLSRAVTGADIRRAPDLVGSGN